MKMGQTQAAGIATAVEEANSDNGNELARYIDRQNSLSSFSAQIVEFIIWFIFEKARELWRPATRTQIAVDLDDTLRSRFPEFGHIDVLRRQARVVVEQPSTSYRDSGLTYDRYLRKYFAKNISQGFLPVPQIEDEQLRKRISVEKSRDLFPSDLQDVCLTQAEILDQRRRAVAFLAAIDDIDSKAFLSFARGIFPQQR